MFQRIRKFFHGLGDMHQRLQHLDKREEELISQLSPDDATVCLKDAQTEKLGRGRPSPPGAGGNVKGLAFILVACLALAAGGGCSGLGTKTAKDLDTGLSMVLPEYLGYVEVDLKLSKEQKLDRQNQVRAIFDVLKAAQK